MLNRFFTSKFPHRIGQYFAFIAIDTDRFGRHTVESNLFIELPNQRGIKHIRFVEEVDCQMVLDQFVTAALQKLDEKIVGVGRETHFKWEPFDWKEGFKLLRYAGLSDDQVKDIHVKGLSAEVALELQNEYGEVRRTVPIRAVDVVPG